ncbi:MAG: DNA mismatch repair protein MutL [Gemmatimonadaceae bacterium]|nr:DNA mismatch repair protein MutL [Gemmatimonadaceae bacterium]
MSHPSLVLRFVTRAGCALEPDTRALAVMTRIAVLSSEVADQIAAGEVVERPASAVKELVENALDAGASSIDIVVEDGGRTLIRVSDNGAGMDPEDARLALSRHATSKIRSITDLVGVGSFGFRGEALPAICSVSRLQLLTAAEDGTAVLVRAEGGHVVGEESAARQRGTTVTVGQLFYNTPARRKFLRSARAEWRAIAETLVTVALVRRDLHLTATHDGRKALALAPSRSLRERIAAIWGNEYAQRFVDVDAVLGPIRVRGLVERPADVGSASRRIALLINGRPVRDTGCVRAAESAYRTTLAPGLRPSLFLEVTLPGDAVDVNVHPAKAEVRFHDRWSVERAIEFAVRRALGSPSAAAAFGGIRRAIDWPLQSDVSIDRPPLPSDLAAGPLFQCVVPGTASATAPTTDDPAALPSLRQLRRTYIVYESDDGVILIDQHSAHERILYERFAREIESGSATSQRLLLPETVHLSADESEAMEAAADPLRRLGFEIEAFGGSSVIVHAVPYPHRRFDALRCLRETLASLAGDRVPTAHARHERLLATVACKAAIKAGDLLSEAEMTTLVRGLASTSLPAHDVHGRSTIVRLGWDELDRRFGRR